MDCFKARQFLNPFIDGELAGPQDRELVAHLASCPACMTELKGLRRSVALVRDLPHLAPPPGLLSQVMAMVMREARPKEAAAGGVFGWILAAVLGGLGALLVYGYLGEAGMPWDPSTFDAVQSIGWEELPSMMASMEAGLIIGFTLLFVAVASLLLQLISKEQRCEHG